MVLRYRAFRDEIRAKGVTIPIPCHIVFYIQMPGGWSAKKKARMNLQPHCQKPDADNLVKAIFDSVFENDSHVWKFSVEKRWRDKPGISIEPLD